MQNNKTIKVILGVSITVILLVAALLYVGAHESKTFQAEMPNYAQADDEPNPEGMELDDQPSKGSEDAPVQVVKFGDYKCQACQQWAEGVHPILDETYIEEGLVEFSFINFQFMEEDSILVGIAGESIYHQEEALFWDFYDEIFAHEPVTHSNWGTIDSIVGFVEETVEGVDIDGLREDLETHAYLDDVYRDYVIASEHGVTASPSLFVNGEQVEDSSGEALFRDIEIALEEAENDEE